jgi:hypothetical protein
MRTATTILNQGERFTDRSYRRTLAGGNRPE